MTDNEANTDVQLLPTLGGKPTSAHHLGTNAEGTKTHRWRGF